MQIVLSLLSLLMLSTSGCTKAKIGPEIRVESIRLSEGQLIAVGNESRTKFGRMQITAPQNGIMFVQTTIYPAHNDLLDTSGIRRVYFFVPDRYVAEAKKGRVVSVNQANGLLSMEYSQNDAFPERYCFQELSIGSIFLRMEDDRHEVVISSHLKAPPASGATDARCDASEFSDTTVFPLPREIS